MGVMPAKSGRLSRIRRSITARQPTQRLMVTKLGCCIATVYDSNTGGSTDYTELVLCDTRAGPGRLEGHGLGRVLDVTGGVRGRMGASWVPYTLTLSLNRSEKNFRDQSV